MAWGGCGRGEDGGDPAVVKVEFSLLQTAPQISDKLAALGTELGDAKVSDTGERSECGADGRVVREKGFDMGDGEVCEGRGAGGECAEERVGREVRGELGGREGEFEDGGMGRE